MWGEDGNGVRLIKLNGSYFFTLLECCDIDHRTLRPMTIAVTWLRTRHFAQYPARFKDESAPVMVSRPFMMVV
jgi:hypothetical protein